VKLADASGKRQGSSVLEILERPGKSCLDVDGLPQHQVKDLSVDGTPRIRIGETAVASLSETHIVIDFTAGICDSYYLFDGKLTAESASGDIVTQDLGGSEVVGHFAAARTR
jgi:hypothetical protein